MYWQMLEDRARGGTCLWVSVLHFHDQYLLHTCMIHELKMLVKQGRVEVGACMGLHVALA